MSRENFCIGKKQLHATLAGRDFKHSHAKEAPVSKHTPGDQGCVSTDLVNFPACLRNSYLSVHFSFLHNAWDNLVGFLDVPS